MSDSSHEDSDVFDATLAFAGLAAAGVGLWKLVQNLSGNQDQRTAESLFASAEQLEQQGRVGEALQALNEAINKDSQYAAAHNLKAWYLATHTSDLQTAAKHAYAAIHFAPNNFDKANYYDTLAEIYLRATQIDDAISHFRQCLALLNNDDSKWPASSACYRLAICYEMKQDLQNALYFLDRAARADPQNPDVHLHLGLTYSQLEQYHDAITHFMEAVRLARANTALPAESRSIGESICLNGIGNAYYHLDHLPESRQAFEAAYQLCPFNPYPILNRASLAAHDGDKDKLRFYLGKGVPLIVDTEYFQGTQGLVQFLLVESNFEPYRDIVLESLKNHGKIDKYIYQQHMKTWQERKQAGGSRSMTVNIMGGSTVGTVATGDNATISDVFTS